MIYVMLGVGIMSQALTLNCPLCNKWNDTHEVPVVTFYVLLNATSRGQFHFCSLLFCKKDKIQKAVKMIFLSCTEVTGCVIFFPFGVVKCKATGGFK